MSARAVRRVAFTIPSLNDGGAERVFATLLRHLSRERFELHLVLLEGTGRFVRDLPPDVTVHVVGAARLRHGLPGLIRILRRLKPDAVVTTQGYLNFALLAVRFALPPLRLVVREVIGDQYLEGSPFRHLFYRCYLALCGRADGIVLQSDQARADLIATRPALASRARRIYNPLDLRAIDAATAGTHSPFQPGRGGLQLVSAGRLTWQKGFDILLAGFALVVARGLSVHLTILGDGPERAALAAAVRHRGLDAHVTLRGLEPGIHRYLRHADLFALASRYEGLPNALLEALACGCPVVATRCRWGVQEIVQDGANGLLVPPDDAEALGAALARVLQDGALRRRLREAARPSVERFDVAGIIREWEELLDASG